ncbi:kptA [Symbiodinium microadriaticum]|nr:kptA [Symbiodinium microadriaticum]
METRREKEKAVAEEAKDKEEGSRGIVTTTGPDTPKSIETTETAVTAMIAEMASHTMKATDVAEMNTGIGKSPKRKGGRSEGSPEMIAGREEMMTASETEVATATEETGQIGAKAGLGRTAVPGKMPIVRIADPIVEMMNPSAPTEAGVGAPNAGMRLARTARRGQTGAQAEDHPADREEEEAAGKSADEDEDGPPPLPRGNVQGGYERICSRNRPRMGSDPEEEEWESTEGEEEAAEGFSKAVDYDEVHERVDPEKVPDLIHGTHYDFYKKIFKEGLLPGAGNRDYRDQVHLLEATNIGSRLLSPKCDIILHIDPALATGCRFYKSANGYYLTGEPIGPQAISAVTIKETKERVEAEKKGSPPLPSIVLQETKQLRQQRPRPPKGGAAGPGDLGELSTRLKAPEELIAAVIALHDTSAYHIHDVHDFAKFLAHLLQVMRTLGLHVNLTKTALLIRARGSRRLLSLTHRLRIWRACAVSSATFGLTPLGMTYPAATLLRGWFYKQLRAVTFTPAHISHVSNEALSAKHGIPDPVDQLEQSIRQKRDKLRNKEEDITSTAGIQDFWEQTHLAYQALTTTALQASPVVPVKPTVTGLACAELQWRAHGIGQVAQMWGTHSPMADDDQSDDELVRTRPKQAHLLTLAKMLARHEMALQQLEADRSWVIFVDSGSMGIISLRQALMGAMLLELEARMAKLAQDTAAQTSLVRAKILLQDPLRWQYTRWNQEKQAHEPTNGAPLSHETALTALRELKSLILQEGTMHAFHAMRNERGEGGSHALQAALSMEAPAKATIREILTQFTESSVLLRPERYHSAIASQKSMVVPTFTEGIDTMPQAYVLHSVVYHIGCTPGSGHYRTMGMTESHPALHVQNDETPTALATSTDLEEDERNIAEGQDPSGSNATFLSAVPSQWHNAPTTKGTIAEAALMGDRAADPALVVTKLVRCRTEQAGPFLDQVQLCSSIAERLPDFCASNCSDFMAAREATSEELKTKLQSSEEALQDARAKALQHALAEEQVQVKCGEKVAEAQVEAQALQAANEALQSQVKELQTQVEVTQQQLTAVSQTFEAEAADAAAQLVAARKKVENHESELRESMLAAQKLQVTNDELAKELQSSEEALQESNPDVEAQKQAAAAELETCAAAVARAEVDKQELQAKFAELRGQLFAAVQAQEASKELIEALRGEVASASTLPEENLCSTQSELADAVTAKERLQADVDRLKFAEINANMTKSAKDRAEAQVKELKLDLEHWRQKALSFQRDEDRAKRQSQDISSLEVEVKDLHQQNAQLLLTFQQFKTELETTLAENHGLQETIDMYEMNLQRATDQKAELMGHSNPKLPPAGMAQEKTRPTPGM